MTYVVIRQLEDNKRVYYSAEYDAFKSVGLATHFVERGIADRVARRFRDEDAHASPDASNVGILEVWETTKGDKQYDKID